MQLQDRLTTEEIRAVFAEAIAAQGGTVSETFDDGHRLFLRSLLPRVREVRAKDRLQGGVALRATEEDVWVHPYIFRQVCSNGAIMAHALESAHVELADSSTPDEVAGAIRAAVEVCCADEAFATGTARMRSAQLADIDLALNLVAFFSRVPEQSRAQVVQAVLEQLFHEPHRTRYDLMNAVTAVARDTRDPALRWRLEELGGDIGAGLDPDPTPDDASAAAEVPDAEELLLV